MLSATGSTYESSCSERGARASIPPSTFHASYCAQERSGGRKAELATPYPWPLRAPSARMPANTPGLLWEGEGEREEDLEKEEDLEVFKDTGRLSPWS